MKKILTFITLAIAAVIPASAGAATTDVADLNATVNGVTYDSVFSPPLSSYTPGYNYVNLTVPVNTPVTFTEITPCTVACGYSWVYQNGTRLGVTLPRTKGVTYTFTKVGPTKVTGSLDEACAGSGGRLTCHSNMIAFLNVVGG